MTRKCAATAGMLVLTSSALAQNLMIPTPVTPGLLGGTATGTELQQLSSLSISPPKPREFRVHDLVTIIVDESSRQQAQQSLKTDKKYNNESTLGTIVDPWELLELRLRAGGTQDLKLLDVDSNAKFDSKGNFERNDRLQMKIQARILDVKPNGNLVLEARKFIDKNGETQETVLSGSCRMEDVTGSNTIFSSQLADLSLSTRHTGEVDKAGKKGLIPRVLETLFAF